MYQSGKTSQIFNRTRFDKATFHILSNAPIRNSRYETLRINVFTLLGIQLDCAPNDPTSAPNDLVTSCQQSDLNCDVKCFQL